MQNRKALYLNILSTIIWVLLLMPAAFIAGFSAMLFDAPGSEDAFFTLMLFYSIISFFPAVIASIAGGWIFFILRKFRVSLAFTILPLMSILSAIIAFISISVFCSGSLVCR